MADNPVSDPWLELKEEEVLYDIGLNPEKSYSIFNCVKYARENANSARDLISTELYEALNKFYHYVNGYPAEVFVKNGLYDFTVSIMESSSILRGKVRGTLLHDEVYAIIMLGINLERAMQIVRMVHTKYLDALQAQGSYGDKFKNSYEWTTLLKCNEAYDMMRRLYRQSPTSLTTLEFLILNASCPRSVMNSLNQVCNHVKTVSREKDFTKKSAQFLTEKIRAEYKYKLGEEIESDIEGFIKNIEEKLYLIATTIENEYFNYY